MPPARGSDLNPFLARRQAQWRRLEALLLRVETRGLADLSEAEVREFAGLYRRASSDLVVARAKTANAELLDYLNDLVARAYAQAHRSRRFEPRDLLTFLRLDFPRLVRRASRPIALAATILLLSMLFGWSVSRRDPVFAYTLLPADLVRGIPVMREHWRTSTGHSIGANEMAVLSSFIMAHNIAIGFAVFAGGIALGIPSFYAMLQTGAMLGILGEGMTRPGTALAFWSLILPHGILELSAICIMGGAGFLLAGALLAPGRRTRRDALIERGRLAVPVALGGAAMLVVAGLIEGFITPPAFLPPAVKLVFAALTLVAELFYFLRAGRGEEPGLFPELLADSAGTEASPI